MEKFAGRPLLLPLFVFVLYGATLFSSSSAADTMHGTASLRDGETLVSAGGSFELGFVSLGASPKKYLCIRSTKGQERPIVWVANRERPLNVSTGGALKFEGDGNLAVLDGVGNVFWSTGLPPSVSGRRAAQLLDTGNLVVREVGDRLPGSFLWQSFHEPGDTLLPGMKLQVNNKTGASRHLTSWKSAGDPSQGDYSFRLEINILPRLVLREGSSTIKITTGLWNGIRFTGFQPMNANDLFNSSVVFSGDEVYYTDTMIDNSSLLRLRLDSSGELRPFVWSEKTRTWSILWTVPSYCEQYARCGPYGTCAEDRFPSCNCLRGFRPKLPLEWSYGRATVGCVRSTNLSCSGGDAFLPVMGVKLPELNINATVDMKMNLEECRERCARDCSCTAYASADVKEGRRGCITWSGDLVDVRNLSTNVQEFYLRVAATDAGNHTSLILTKL